MTNIFKFATSAVLVAIAYTAQAAEPLQPVSISPESGSAIESGTAIILTYADELTDGTSWSDITIEPTSGSPVTYPMAYIDWNDTHKYVIGFSPEEPQSGMTYKVTIPANKIQNSDGTGNAALELYYTLGGEATVGISWMVPGEEGVVESIHNPLTICWDTTVEYNPAKTVKFWHNGTQHAVSVTEVIGMWQFTIDGFGEYIETPGNYRLNVPAGTFTTSSGAANKDCTFNWIIKGGSNVSPVEFTGFTPADGSSVEFGKAIELTFATDVTGNTSDSNVLLENLTKGTSSNASLEYGSSNNSMKFSFKPQGAATGDVVRCTIAAGSIWSVSNDRSRNEEIVGTFTVASENTQTGTLEVTLNSPEEGIYDPETQGGLSTFTLSVTSPVTVQGNPGIILRNTSSGYVYTCSASPWALDGSDYVRISIDGELEVSSPGEYTLTVPAGAFADATGASNPALEYHWTIEGQALSSLVPVSVEPTGIATSLSYFYLNFDQVVTVIDGAKASIKFGNTENAAGLRVSADNAMRVELAIDEAYTAEGEYTITIPAGAIANAAGVANNTLIYTLTVGDRTVAITSLTPSIDSPLAAIKEGDTMVVTLNNPAAVGTIMASLWDLDAVIADESNVFALKEFTKQPDGSFAWTNYAIDYVLYEGHRYELRLECYEGTNPWTSSPFATLKAIYHGGTAGYTYSDAHILDITPEPGSIISTGNSTVTITFSKAVNFTSGYATEGGQLAATSEITGTKANTEGTAWTLTVSEAFVSSIFGEITFIAGFTDADGRTVTLTENSADLYVYGENADRQIAIHYLCIEGGKTVDIDPAAGTVAKLYEFKFSNPNASSMNAINWGELQPDAIELLDAAGNRVAAGSKVTTELEEESTTDPEAVNHWVKVTLNTEITEAGNYTLIVPWQSFILGQEFSSDGFKGMEVTYTVDPSNGVAGIRTDCAPRDVYNMQGILLIRNASQEQIGKLAPGMYIIGGHVFIKKI